MGLQCGVVKSRGKWHKFWLTLDSKIKIFTDYVKLIF